MFCTMEWAFKRINPILCLLFLCPDMFGAIHALSSQYLPVLASYFHNLFGEHRAAQSMFFILLSYFDVSELFTK